MVGNSSEMGRPVALQPDGKIVMTGDFYNLAHDHLEIAVVRLNPDGSVDSRRPTSQTTSRPRYTQPTTCPAPIFLSNFRHRRPRQHRDAEGDAGADVLLLRDGKILVAGDFSNGAGSQFALWRYNANGTLDTTFGNGGKVITAFGNGNAMGDIKQAPDGKIVLVGTNGPFSDTQIAVARYNLDGTLDRTFAAVNTLGGATVFTEGGAPVVLDSDVTIYDEELPAGGNFSGGSLTLVRPGGANAADVFGASGNLAALTTGAARSLSAATRSAP